MSQDKLANLSELLLCHLRIVKDIIRHQDSSPRMSILPQRVGEEVLRISASQGHGDGISTRFRSQRDQLQLSGFGQLTCAP